MGGSFTRISMPITRRKLIACSTILATSGCLSIEDPLSNVGVANPNPHVKFSGNVSTGEPLVVDANLSTDVAYPNHYSALLRSEETADRIRWEYIRQEIPMFVDDLEGTNFDSEFLLLFGMVLPRIKQLESGPIRYEDGTLYSEYQIEDRSSSSTEMSINTNVQRIVADEIPEDVEYEVRF